MEDDRHAQAPWHDGVVADETDRPFRAKCLGLQSVHLGDVVADDLLSG